MKSQTFIPIVYQDQDLILINKRAGLASQGGAGVGRSVDTDLAEQIGQKIYLCHRLDKETSGLLLCAKNPQAAGKWSRLIGEKSVKKEYKALCFGKPKNPSGKITLPVREKGQPKSALTYYELEKTFAQEEAGGFDASPLSVMRLSLGTGRTHQIRIHLAQSGLPIVGDDKYGDFGLNKAAKRDLSIKRLCLCAFRLTLPMEGGERAFEIECDFMPADLF
ncbi:MAG: RluA family pseudouridine synthase [Treponema sp.]|nr:RluA family pseudouridine synthase [Treponema sp.]